MKRKTILFLLVISLLLCGCSSKSSLQKKLDTPGCFVNEKTGLFQVPGIEWGQTFQDTLNNMDVKATDKDYIESSMEDSYSITVLSGMEIERNYFLFNQDKLSVDYGLRDGDCFWIDFCRNGYDYPDVEQGFCFLQRWYEKFIIEYGTESYYTNFDMFSSANDLQQGETVYAVWKRTRDNKVSVLCLEAFAMIDDTSGVPKLMIHIILGADIEGVTCVDEMAPYYSFLQDLDLSGKSD